MCGCGCHLAFIAAAEAEAASAGRRTTEPVQVEPAAPERARISVLVARRLRRTAIYALGRDLSVGIGR
jgi:hypothetical protein